MVVINDSWDQMMTCCRHFQSFCSTGEKPAVRMHIYYYRNDGTCIISAPHAPRGLGMPPPVKLGMSDRPMAIVGVLNMPVNIPSFGTNLLMSSYDVSGDIALIEGSSVISILGTHKPNLQRRICETRWKLLRIRPSERHPLSILSVRRLASLCISSLSEASWTR